MMHMQQTLHDMDQTSLPQLATALASQVRSNQPQYNSYSITHGEGFGEADLDQISYTVGCTARRCKSQ